MSIISKETPTHTKDPNVSRYYPGTVFSIEDTTIDAHEDECFYIRTTDEDCFSLSVGESDCFYIKSDGESDGEDDGDLPFEDEIDFSDLDMTAVKCIQSHGLNSMKVIAKYKPEDVEMEVIADVVYVPSVDGGIGSVLSVYNFTELSEICNSFLDADKFTYGDVVRLECWDNASGLSPLAIVTSTEVHWIEPVLLGLSTSTVNIGNGSIAIKNPFLTEETFGVYDGVTSWSNSLACGTSVGGLTDVTSGYYISDGTAAPTQDIITLGGVLSNAENPNIDVSCGYVNSEHVGERPNVLIAMRKDIFITEGGKVIPDIVLEDANVLTVFASPTVWFGYYDIPYAVWSEANSLPVAGTVTTTNISFDGDYVVALIDGQLEWVDTNSTASGFLEGTNFTVSTGVAIIADGTPIVTQTILADEEPTP